MADLKYAVRSLTRNPLFACGAIATLALGIGVNSTIFTLANGAFFKPMRGIADAPRLAWVSAMWLDRGRAGDLSYREFVDVERASAPLFTSLSAFAPVPLSLGSGGEPQRVRGHLVSGSYFVTLGAAPAQAGRLLQSSDDRPGAPPVAVLGQRLWRDRFGGDDVIDRAIVINGHQVTVVGVAAEGFAGPELGQAADIWLPLAALPAINTAQAAWLGDGRQQWLHVIGRLRDGVTISRAQAALTVIAGGLERTQPNDARERTLVVSSASSGVRPSERGELLPIAALLLVVTGLVLLIACANVANLILARGAGRAHEIGVRAALGASRWRLIRQLLTESLVLAGAGAAGGLLLSFWAARLLVAQLPDAEFRGMHATADPRVFLFTSALAVISACAFGLVPALAATRSALLPRLRQTAAAGGRSRTQGIFVVTQLSLSLVLLLAGGLSLRALQKASGIDLGFNPRQLVTASYDLALQDYSLGRRDAFRRDLMARVGALPATASVTITDVPPLSGTMVGTVVTATGDRGESLERHTYVSSVAPNYFATLQIPLVRGRGISDADRRGAPAAAVINETLAAQLWASADPLGQVLRFDDEAVQVVGVVRDIKYDEATETPRPFVYLSLAQHSQLDRETIVVRTNGGAAAAIAAIRAEFRALDPALPIFDVRAFDTILRDRADKQRALSALLAGFGALALLLAALGLYGVMAYVVVRRTREIGVRLALGATPDHLTRLIAGDGLRLALTGVVIGGLLALPLAQALGALVFGVRIADLLTFAAACALLVAVAMIAAVVPARRAARLDPVVALRTE